MTRPHTATAAIAVSLVVAVVCAAAGSGAPPVQAAPHSVPAAPAVTPREPLGPLLAQPYRIPLRRAPQALATADFNRDGRADFAVSYANKTPGNPPDEVLLSDGSGGHKTVALPTRGTGVAAADVNGDGNPDILVTRTGLRALLGDGRGGFASPVPILTSGTGPESVVPADLDGDGDLDLAVGHAGSQEVSSLLGDGRGGFALQSRFRTGAGSVTLAALDLDGDGAAEVVSAPGRSLGPIKDAGLARNDGTGRLAPAQPLGWTNGTVGVGDADGDGHPDLVLSDLSGLSLLRSDGAGGLGTPARIELGCPETGTSEYPCAADALAVGDLDGDGRADLALKDRQGVAVSLADARGGFGTPLRLDTRINTGRFLAIADVDGDCAPDLALNDWRAIAVYLNVRQIACSDGPIPAGRRASAPEADNRSAPAGGPSFAGALPFGAAGRDVVAADLDGDGLSDVAYLGRQKIVVRLGDRSRGLGPPRSIPAGKGFPFGLAAGDINGDGDLDLVTSVGGALTVLTGDGKGSFAGPRRPLEADVVVLPQRLADLDADGDLDVVAYGQGEPTLQVLLGNGSGGFATGSATALQVAGYYTARPAVADVDGDGDLDVAALARPERSGGRSRSPGVAVFHNDGKGNLAGPVMVAAGDVYDGSVTAGDADGDGRVDLVVTHTRRMGKVHNVEYGPDPYPGYAVALLRGDGAGGFAPPVLVDTGGAAPAEVAIADVTGEGIPDLVLANGASDESAVLAGDGAGAFAAPVAFGPDGTFPAALTLADVNGDGALDLVTIGRTRDRAGSFEEDPGILTVRLNTSPLARTTGGLLR